MDNVHLYHSTPCSRLSLNDFITYSLLATISDKSGVDSEVLKIVASNDECVLKVKMDHAYSYSFVVVF